MSVTTSNGPINPNQEVESHAGAEFFCETLKSLDDTTNVAGCNILVAGCGAGHEAALIQRILLANVEAVDVEDFVSDEFKQWPNLNFQTASVCELPFADGQFDAIFYHHVIEHVEDPVASLTELSRVVKPDGWIFIGTPNRYRLVSSVGAHRQSTWEPTWQNKLNDNVKDWSARFRGRFHNRYGAHAGFSQGELTRMLKADFGTQKWCTKAYLKYKYLNHRFASAVSLIATPPLRGIGTPSVYVFAQKPA